MKQLKQTGPIFTFLVILFGGLLAAKKFDKPPIHDKIQAHFESGAVTYEVTAESLSSADWFHLRGNYKLDTNYYATPSGLVECLIISTKN